MSSWSPPPADSPATADGDNWSRGTPAGAPPPPNLPTVTPFFDPATGRARRVTYRLICAAPMVLTIGWMLSQWLWNLRQIQWDRGMVLGCITMGLEIGCVVCLALPRLQLRVLVLGMLFLFALVEIPALTVQIFSGWILYLLSSGGSFEFMLFLIPAILTTFATPFIAPRLLRLEIDREWFRRQQPPLARTPFPLPAFVTDSRWERSGWWALLLLPLGAHLVIAATWLWRSLGPLAEVRWTFFFQNLLMIGAIAGFAAVALRSGRAPWRLLLYGALVQAALSQLLKWVPSLVLMERPSVGGTFLWTGLADPFFIATTVWYGFLSVGLVVSLVLAWRRLRADLQQLHLAAAAGTEAEEDLAAPGWDEGGQVR